MATIKDFIENNEDTKVRVEVTPSLEEVGICNETIYEGMLSDIPEELHDREVVYEGLAIFTQINVLRILRK